jgi:hypothetical protein
MNLRNKLLWLGYFIAICFCYTFTIKKTLASYVEYKARIQGAIDSREASATLFRLDQKEKNLNLIARSYNIAASGTFQNDLLKKLNSECHRNGLRIIDFKEPHINKDEDLITTSYIFTLEGSFNGTILVIRSLEKNPSLGKINHVDFHKKKDFKTNSLKLETQIILQQKK